MNPSYVRIRVPLADALARFAQWIGLAPLGPPVEKTSTDAIDAACEGETWRSVVAVFIHRSGEWTVFDDLTGHLSSFTGLRWQSLAGSNELVFAAYNDAIPFGQIIVIREGRIAREFLDDPQDREGNVNEGRLDCERSHPIDSWVEAASFVDEDLMTFNPDVGLLWMFGDVTDRDEAAMTVR